MNIILLSILLMVALVLIIPNVYADSTPIRANINIQYIDPLYPGDRVSFNFITTSQPLSSDVLAISAMDTQRRSTTTFVNEGVEFVTVLHN